MKAFKIRVGMLVNLGTERSAHGPHMDRPRPPAEVLDVEQNGGLVELQLRQVGKRRAYWVGIPEGKDVQTTPRTRAPRTT